MLIFVRVVVQLNGDIMQVGGYIKTSDFYANILTNTALYTATVVTMRIKRAKCSIIVWVLTTISAENGGIAIT